MTGFQPQRRIGGIMALVLALVVIIIPLQLKGAKQAVNLEAGPSLGLLAGLGLIGRINAVGGLLQKESHQGVG